MSPTLRSLLSPSPAETPDALPYCRDRVRTVGASKCCGATYECARHGRVSAKRCGACVKPTILIVRRKGYRKHFTDTAEAKLRAAGWDVTETTDGGTKALQKRILDKRPDVVLRWEEHGTLFVSDRWREFVAWCYQQDVCPLSIDMGYFSHYKSVIVDRYRREDAASMIGPELDGMPTTVDWGHATEYRDGLLRAWDAAEDPVDDLEPGYVLLMLQFSSTLARPEFRAHDMTAWAEKACGVLRAAGRRVVMKAGPVGPYPDIDGVPCYSAKKPRPVAPGLQVRVDPDLNVRLMRHASHVVTLTSSVTNEAVICGVPVTACGRSWFTGLGVFHEPPDWSGIVDVPTVDTARRAQWASWWIDRQAPPADAPRLIARRLAECRAEPYDYAGLYGTLYADDSRYGGRYPRIAAALRLARHTGAQSLLDVGCGRGWLVADALDAGLRAEGVDAAVPPNAVTPAITQGSALDLPHEDDTFDAVAMLDMLEHLREDDARLAVAEAVRVARVCLVVSVGLAPAAWPSPAGWPNLHKTVRPIAWWRGVLRAHGLRVTDHDGIILGMLHDG